MGAPGVEADIVRAMTQDQAASLSAGWSKTVRVATMFSGLEGVKFVAEDLASALQMVWGLQITIEWVYAVEIDPMCLKYIELENPSPLVFKDVGEMCNSHAPLAFSGEVHVIPDDVDIIVAGIMCSTTCHLACSVEARKRKKNCIAEGGRFTYLRFAASWDLVLRVGFHFSGL